MFLFKHIHFHLNILKRSLFFLSILFFLSSGCSFLQPGKNEPVPTPAAQIVSPSPIITETAIPPSPTLDCRQSPGIVTMQQIQSKTLRKELSFSVYTPPCYSGTFLGGFPVLYLLHGQTFDQSQWQQLGAIAIANELIAFDPVLSPFIIVMPFEKDNISDPYETHYGDALALDLVSWIDQNYNTCTLRTCRAIAGLSRGAAWAVWTGLHYPQLFAFIGGHSFPPFVGDLYRLPTWLRAIPEDNQPYIFLDSGKDDPWLPDARRFEEVLTQFSIPHSFKVNEGDHSESYWQAHVREYILQLAGAVSQTR